MTERYYVVREDLLPEAIVKTFRVLDMLKRGEAETVNEAVERVGLSRSAFYKYKDGVYALDSLDRERIVTISMDLEHRAGTLSKVLAYVAQCEGNVLTIHQSIPLQGLANVVISVDISGLNAPLPVLIEGIRKQDGVRRAAVAGQG
jgi:chorismate mutase